jgi:drug/metabolite transporter (DMT)-like permease
MSVPLSALLLVVAASFGWAGFDLLRKLLVQEIPPMALVFLLTAGTAPLFAVWMLLDGVAAPRPGYWGPALASVILNIVANLLFLVGMRMAPLSVTVPLLSLTPAFTALLAVPMLGERLSLATVAGILMVILGALWLSLLPPRTRGGEPPADLRDRRGKLEGTLLVALTAVFWSLVIPLDKLALARAMAPLHGLVLTGGVAAGAFLVLAGQRRFGEIARARPVAGYLVLALAVSGLALGLQLLALPRVYAGTLETLKRGIGNFMALASGWIFFREAVTGPKVLAVALMAAGVWLIVK